MRAGREELLFMSHVSATQESNAKEGREELQGSRYLLCQRFSACFLWEIAPQRGEGEKKREGVQNFKTKHTEPLTSQLPRPLYRRPPRQCSETEWAMRLLLVTDFLIITLDHCSERGSNNIYPLRSSTYIETCYLLSVTTLIL